MTFYTTNLLLIRLEKINKREKNRKELITGFGRFKC